MNDRLFELDSLADDFETDWLAGNSPDIGEWLGKVGKDQQADLAKLLIPIDIEYGESRRYEIDFEKNYGFPDSEVAFAVKNELLRYDGKSNSGSPIISSEFSSRSSWREFSLGVCIGPYQLVRRLGLGGMGEVWMAEHKEPVEREVGLKVIPAGIGSKEISSPLRRRTESPCADEPSEHREDARCGNNTRRPALLGVGIGRRKMADEILRLETTWHRRAASAFCQRFFRRPARPSRRNHSPLLETVQYTGQCVRWKRVPKVIDFGLAKALEHLGHIQRQKLFQITL